MTDQCAIGPDGQLLDASEIKFFNNPDDSTPLPPIPPDGVNIQAGEGMLLLCWHHSKF
jgi:hypothetical protein